VKWGAALYLLYIAGHGLLIDANESTPDETVGEKIAKRLGLSPFAQAVVAVELADIAFSVDSITAALAFSTKLAVVFIGGCLGILAMRYAAGIFLSLIQRYPLLNKVAFLLVGIIGLKLFVGAGAFPGFFGLDWIDLNIEVPEWLGLSVIFGTFVGAIGIAHFFPKSRIAQWGSAQTHELAEEIEDIREDNK
jgi:predicted tellurium resistance membrane protein TerC